jgi:hypothetical protein
LKSEAAVVSFFESFQTKYLLSSDSSFVGKPTILERFGVRNKILFGFENLPLNFDFSLVVSSSFKVGFYENEFTSRWILSREKGFTKKNTTSRTSFCAPSPSNLTYPQISGISPTGANFKIVHHQSEEKISFQSNFIELSVKNFTFEGEFYEFKNSFNVKPEKKESYITSNIKFEQYTAPSFENVQANVFTPILPVEHVVSPFEFIFLIYRNYIQKLLSEFSLNKNISYSIRDTTFKFKDYWVYSFSSKFSVICNWKHLERT